MDMVSRRAEIGSTSRPGGRKPSLNHLLNFNYGNRDSGGGRRVSHHQFGAGHGHGGHGHVHGHRGGGGGGGAGTTGTTKTWTTKKHKYNKEQFLQANCQFVVRDGEDYAVHSADPDLLVDWEWIEQVRIPGHEVPSCPICLYPPVAAKMTRCGHVYCWACILHYLALSDKTWRKCPICYEAIHKGDLKSVVSLETACYRVGDRICMQLMRRERGSVISLPRARWTEALQTSGRLNVGVQGLDAAGQDACYAKLLVATREQVFDVLLREQSELEAALICLHDGYGDGTGEPSPESCFVEDALEQLRMRREKLMEGAQTTDQVPLSKVDSAVEIVVEYSAGTSEGGLNDGHEGHGLEHSCDVTKVDQTFNHQPLTHGKQGKETYYFYQAVDGQHIYMHSVNVAMLVREYGNLEHSPNLVSAVIVERETVSMNEELRNRLRCLCHLPLTCQFELVELNFSTSSTEKSIVSQSTLIAFKDEIKKRNQRRSRRAREENRRERRLHTESEKSGIRIPVRAPRFHLDNQRQFPACGSDGGSGSSPSPVSPSDHLLESPVDYGASSSGISFAQMLRAGKDKKPNEVRHGKQDIQGRTHNNEDERDSDAGSPVPTFRDSFSAALSDPHLGIRSVTEDETDRDTDPNGHQSHHRCKKGKKATKRLLFSTTIVHSK